MNTRNRFSFAWAGLLSMFVVSACGEQELDVSGDADGLGSAQGGSGEGGEGEVGKALLGDECEPIDLIPGSVPETTDEDNTQSEEDALAKRCRWPLACEPLVTSDDDSASGEQREYRCAKAVVIEGQVEDADQKSPIAKANVLALRTTQMPFGDRAVSDEQGAYQLRVSFPRYEDGSIAEGVDTIAQLQAFASDYQAFPDGLRTSIPFDVRDELEEQDELFVYRSSLTTLSLFQLADEQCECTTVHGFVNGEGQVGGTLVTASSENGESSSWTIADRRGNFTLFNVSGGESVRFQAYRQGRNYEPIIWEAADFPEEPDKEQDDEQEQDEKLLVFELQNESTSEVRGSVNMVNAPGEAKTSVVLVPSEVFNEGLGRGPIPPGLRAPGALGEFSVERDFVLTGVPAGRYKVLAALENDQLVRDPDQSIAGTELLEIEVSAGQNEILLSESFKVTEALAVVYPGAKEVEEVRGLSEFRFQDDSGEDRYEVFLIDSFGEVLWENKDVPGVSGSSEVVVPYDGPELEDGHYYQLRAVSWKDKGSVPSALSATEELRGVFIFRPENAGSDVDGSGENDDD